MKKKWIRLPNTNTENVSNNFWCFMKYIYYPHEYDRNKNTYMSY